MRLRQWRLLVPASLAAVLVVIAVLLGSGWYFSELIKSQGLECDWLDPQPDLKVAAIGDGGVTLRATPQTADRSDWRRNGIYGLRSAAAYGQAGAILEIGDQEVIREFLPLTGTTTVGSIVALDHFAFPGDPRTAFNMPFEEITFQSPLGDFPAWFISGRSDTWVIIVHGRRANRREALRILPTIAKLGLPSLTITYRNDQGVPEDPDCFYRYGQTEWEDLEGAARYAVEHGAEHLILVGYSYGGAIVMNFLYQSSFAEMVQGAILDSPLLDLGAVMDLRARERNIPRPIVLYSKAIARSRFGIDWGELNYLRRADELTVPMLLFHGDADDEVPIETSDKLAELRPDIVEYLRVPGASHARAWNTDRNTYEATVRDFLSDWTQ